MKFCEFAFSKRSTGRPPVALRSVNTLVSRGIIRRDRCGVGSRCRILRARGRSLAVFVDRLVSFLISLIAEVSAAVPLYFLSRLVAISARSIIAARRIHVCVVGFFLGLCCRPFCRPNHLDRWLPIRTTEIQKNPLGKQRIR